MLFKGFHSICNSNILSNLKAFQYILLPISLLYEGVLRFRNYLYEKEIFGITEFDIPTINVGNLAFGGTGKTPHIEYLIRLLQKSYRVGVLSRGYKRKTIGYQFANEQATVFSIGDEPFQIFNKFPQIALGVAESRVLGLPNLLFDAPETEVVLLDDAYQHRAISPGLNILLTEEGKLFTDDFLVPSGYLREYKSAYKRADIIVVTKCNPKLSGEEKALIRKKINPFEHQSLFFSCIKYGDLISYYPQVKMEETNEILAFSGIANTQHFEAYLKTIAKKVNLKKFPDHHAFTEKDIHLLIDEFNHLQSDKKIIVSTEKDYQKILQSSFAYLLKDLPIFYLPIEVSFLEGDGEVFDKKINEYVQQNRAINPIS